MPIVHFLNVKQGDCSVIKHYSGRISVIDVCNAKEPEPLGESLTTMFAALEKGPGNYNQKKYPVNPISYLKAHGIDNVFRFIITHPDMDHLDGIKRFFETFRPINVWDTDNNCEKDFNNDTCAGFSREDWEFYCWIRDAKPQDGPKRLALYAGASNQFFNVAADGSDGGDGLHILAPTPQLIRDACSCGDYNDCSYVLLYRTGKYRILFGGDSHDKTWETILRDNRADVADVDVLIAPHHGRDSGRSYEFLDVLRPKLTLFGNASSEHLAYGAWNSRGLRKITNNEAGTIILDAESTANLDVYVTHQPFAQANSQWTFLHNGLKAHYYCSL